MKILLIRFLLILLGGVWGVGASLAAGPPFQRIISLYTAHSENLAAMGATAQLIGVSRFANMPSSLQDIPRFSYREDAEKFIVARPDLVLVRPMIARSYPQLLSKLRQAGITVVSLQPTSVVGIIDYWQELGRLTGRQQEAAAMVAQLQQGLARIAEEVTKVPAHQRPRVYFEAIHKKMKTFAPQSIAIFVLEQAGGINVAADATQMRKTNIAAYGKERILAKAGEIDFFLAQQGRMNPVTIKMIENEPGFAAIKAVRMGRVFLLNEAIVSRPTLGILRGVEEIHALLYGGERR